MVAVGLKILITIAFGFFLYKIHILNENANSVMSKVIIYGSGPCMIFSSVMSLDQSNKTEIIGLIIGGLVLFIFLMIAVFIAAKLLRPGKDLEGIYQVLLMITNGAFLGFPVSEALMGDVGVSYMSILNVYSNIFAFSYGVFLLTKGREQVKFKFTNLLNPGIVAAVLGVILFFAGVSLPEILMTPIEFIGDITSPLAMFTMGSMMATYSLKDLFNNWRYYILALIKLIILPLLVLLAAGAIWGDSSLTYTFMLHVAMPPATIVSMLALTYNSDYKTTSSATGLMNILCIATIPFMWWLANTLY